MDLRYSKQCVFCNHENRENLESKIINGELSQEEAAKIIGVSRQAVNNHIRNHLARSIALAVENKEVNLSAGLNVIEELQAINRETKAILEEARNSKTKDNRLALRAIERLEKQLELQEKVLGHLKEGTTINLQLNTEYLEVKAIILDVLEKYPAARDEFLGRIADVEDVSYD